MYPVHLDDVVARYVFQPLALSFSPSLELRCSFVGGIYFWFWASKNRLSFNWVCSPLAFNIITFWFQSFFCFLFYLVYAIFFSFLPSFFIISFYPINLLVTYWFTVLLVISYKLKYTFFCLIWLSLPGRCNDFGTPPLHLLPFCFWAILRFSVYFKLRTRFLLFYVFIEIYPHFRPFHWSALLLYGILLGLLKELLSVFPSVQFWWQSPSVCICWEVFQLFRNVPRPFS